MSEIDLPEEHGKSECRAAIPLVRLIRDRYNVAAWLIVMVIIFIDCIWMHCAGFTMAIASAARSAMALLVLAGLTLVLHGIARHNRYSEAVARLRIMKVCVIAHAIVIVGFFTYAILILQYMCVALDRPLIDNDLIALDAALGFSWRDLFMWQMRRADWSAVLSVIYLSYVPQVAITAVVLGGTGRTDDLADFMLLFMLIAIFTILVSGLIPASNPLIHFGFIGPHDASPWSKFYPLREGSMTVISLDNGQGLISIPSLHAAHAVLFAYAVRHVRWFFFISIVWNLAMIYSAIPFGAHYLVDIIAGVAVSVLAIAAARYLARRSDLVVK